MVRVLRFGIIVLALALAAPITSDAAKPQRIASLNVCTDQLVIALAERSRIATVTFLAPNPDTSFYYREAKGLPINRGAAEEVLALKPDLIVAGTYTTPATTALLKNSVIGSNYSIPTIASNACGKIFDAWRCCLAKVKKLSNSSVIWIAASRPWFKPA